MTDSSRVPPGSIAWLTNITANRYILCCRYLNVFSVDLNGCIFCLHINSTPCQDKNIMTDSSRVPPGSIATSPTIPSENLQAILNPNNQSTNWDIYNSLVINQIVQLTKRISVNGANLLLYYKSIHFSRIKTCIVLLLFYFSFIYLF
jgi:hypothetical protein